MKNLAIVVVCIAMTALGLAGGYFAAAQKSSRCVEQQLVAKYLLA